MATAYVSQQCPNSDRFMKIVQRLQLTTSDLRVINIDVQAPQHPIQSVPTIVSRQGEFISGTDAFQWLQQFENRLPLEAYATVLGAGDGGLPYTDIESDELVETTPFTYFEA